MTTKSEQETDDKNNEYELLLMCWRSGQISHRQWIDHLTDNDFANWVNDKIKADGVDQERTRLKR